MQDGLWTQWRLSLSETETHGADGHMGRDWSDVSLDKPRVTRVHQRHQKPGERPGFSLGASRRNQLCQPLDFEHWPPEL